jgi:hypothetical protein
MSGNVLSASGGGGGGGGNNIIQMQVNGVNKVLNPSTINLSGQGITNPIGTNTYAIPTVDWSLNGVVISPSGTVARVDFGSGLSGTVSGGILRLTAAGGGAGLPFYFVAAPASPANATTDTTNITNALSSASAAGGGIVVLQAGIYRLNATIAFPSNVTMLGAGITTPDGSGGIPTTGTVLLWTGATHGTMFTMTQVTGCRWENFCLYGGSVLANCASIGLKVVTSGANCAFRDLVFCNFAGTSVPTSTTGAAAIWMMANSPGDAIHGPNHCTFDNINVDVGSLDWQINNGSAISPSTCTGIRLNSAQDTGANTADCYFNTFNNIFIWTSYRGIWLGDSDSNNFTGIHVYCNSNTIGANGSTVQSPTNPAGAIYGTTACRLNRFFGSGASLVLKNNAQVSMDDFDFLDGTSSLVSRVSVASGASARLTNSWGGNGVPAGTYYWSVGGDNLHPLSIAFDESSGKIALTNRAGTTTSF